MANSYAGFLGQRGCWEVEGQRCGTRQPEAERVGHTEWDRGKSHMVECRLIKIWANLIIKASGTSLINKVNGQAFIISIFITQTKP